MKCSVHHKIWKLLAGTSCVSLAVVCFRCHVGSPLSVGADPSHFSGWIFSAFTVSFRIEIDTHVVRPGLPHFKACGSPCNQNFSCYTSQFHSYTAVLSLDPNTEPGSQRGRAKRGKGHKRSWAQDSERSVSVIAQHWAPQQPFSPHNPIISTLAFLDKQRSRGAARSVSPGRSTPKGIRTARRRPGEFLPSIQLALSCRHPAMSLNATLKGLADFFFSLRKPTKQLLAAPIPLKSLQKPPCPCTCCKAHRTAACCLHTPPEENIYFCLPIIEIWLLWGPF